MQPQAPSAKPSAFKLDDAPPPAGPNGMLLQELFAGYPLPPSLTPGMTGDMLVVANPYGYAAPMAGSTAAYTPILITGNPGPDGPVNGLPASFTVTYLNPANGATFSLVVTVIAPGSVPDTAVSPPPKG